MKNLDSKLLMGLIIGAAIGAAIGYLATSDHREDIVDELNKIADKVKDGVNAALHKHKTADAAPEVETPETVAE